MVVMVTLFVYSLKQQLELAKEEVDDRNELRKKVTSQDEELKVLHKVTIPTSRLIVLTTICRKRTHYK